VKAKSLIRQLLCLVKLRAKELCFVFVLGDELGSGGCCKLKKKIEVLSTFDNVRFLQACFLENILPK
jgi:hypothetical protein